MKSIFVAQSDIIIVDYSIFLFDDSIRSLHQNSVAHRIISAAVERNPLKSPLLLRHRLTVSHCLLHSVEHILSVGRLPFVSVFYAPRSTLTTPSQPNSPCSIPNTVLYSTVLCSWHHHAPKHLICDLLTTLLTNSHRQQGRGVQSKVKWIFGGMLDTGFKYCIE